MCLLQAFLSGDFFRWVCNNWLEIFGVITGLLYIGLEINQKSTMWVVGFITSFIYVFVFYRSKLYGDAALYVYYVAASVYGWYCWRHAPKNNDDAPDELPVSRVRLPLISLLSAISVVLYIGIGYLLSRFTDSPVPYYDALGTALSIVATWMLARKILEHWLFWIFINFFTSGLCLYRGLYPTAGLFLVYALMSVAGWFKWKKSFNDISWQSL